MHITSGMLTGNRAATAATAAAVEQQLSSASWISPSKRQRAFLQAAASVAERFSNVRMFIIGAALFDDGHDGEVRCFPKKLGIEKLVESTGFLTDIEEAIYVFDLVHAPIIGERITHWRDCCAKGDEERGQWARFPMANPL
jgi:hypothetical protein